jgi:hypothetical protein
VRNGPCARQFGRLPEEQKVIHSHWRCENCVTLQFSPTNKEMFGQISFFITDRFFFGKRKRRSQSLKKGLPVVAIISAERMDKCAIENAIAIIYDRHYPALSVV